MADDTLTMFGKTYNTVGSANTNLMLQTKGDLKIRWGNKFIDLIKNGKINAESDILKTADSSENINSDGIYLVKNGDKDEIWIKIGKTSINLNQETSLEYISYKEKQELTGDERSVAISNIGLVFDTYANLTLSGIKNGFAYVMETQKFFSIIDGVSSEYKFNAKVSDPLEIGNITIKGTTEEIISKTKLSIDAGSLLAIKINGNNSITMSNSKVNYNQYIVSDKGIQSSTYNTNVGYFIGITDENKAVGVFDEIIVRNGLTRIQLVTYKELITLMNSRSLIPNCEYEIIDFLDIRNITYDNETNLKNSGNANEFKYKNVYPIVVKAKNSLELELKGYFSENPNWIIEYDPYYYHVAKYRTSSGSPTDIAYTKGRIIKMTDEFNNTANFDFKHSTFTNSNKYLFNIANPRISELNKLIELNSTSELIAERSATNAYADASLDVDVEITVTYLDGEPIPIFERVRNTEIVNNTIYLEEPQLENFLLINGKKIIVFNDYIVFSDCSTSSPHNNTINNVKGKYQILQQFDDNIIDSIVYESDLEYLGFPVFINNTSGTLYIKNLDSEEISFNVLEVYENNTFGDVSNTIFRKGLTGNKFNGLEHVIIDNNIINNTFEKPLLDLHIVSSDMVNNIFKGEINTYTDIDYYKIDGTLTNNVFEGDIERVIFDSTCALDSNNFNDTIMYYESASTMFKGQIDKCQFGKLIGCTFLGSSLLYNVLFYNEDLYSYIDMTNVIIDGAIRNSVFRGNITNVHFYDDIDKSTFLGIIGSTSNTSTIGKIEFSTFVADIIYMLAEDSTISYSEFELITRVTINSNAFISNSTFNAEINNCTISGNITSCAFEGLSEGINVTGPLTNVTVLVNMTPTSAQYVENANNEDRYERNYPFVISSARVPKLAALGKKTCTISTISYHDGPIRDIFIVKNSNDDFTPTGIITMFSGLISQIPEGWAICDGTKGTPDLRGRFIRMISDGENVGKKNNTSLVTNGYGTRQAYIKISASNLPNHTHTFNEITISDNITVSGNTDSASTGYYYEQITLNDLTINTGGENLETFYYSSASGVNGTDSAHSHSINISCPISFTFTPTLKTDNFSNNKINIEPLAYALIFIMKL